MKVQRTPRQLLTLLGVVGQQPPNEFADTYVGTLEMLDLVVSELENQQASATDAAAVTGTLLERLVPAGETWWVLGIQATVVAVAVGVSNVVGVEYSVAGDGVLCDVRPHIVGSTIPPVPAAVRNDVAFYAPSRPLILKNGDAVRARLLSTDAAGVQLLSVVATYRTIRV